MTIHMPTTLQAYVRKEALRETAEMPVADRCAMLWYMWQDAWARYKMSCVDLERSAFSHSDRAIIQGLSDALDDVLNMARNP